MSPRQWFKQATMPTHQHLTEGQYLRAAPTVSVFSLLCLFCAFWRHNWPLAFIGFVMLALWGVLVPFILPLQWKRWQARRSRRRRRQGPGRGASAGVPLRPLPPSHTVDAVKAYPEVEPPAA